MELYFKGEKDKLPSVPDIGCKYALKCLCCPYGKCYKEMRPKDRRVFEQMVVEAKIAVAYFRGARPKDLMKDYDIPESTFYKMIKRQRKFHSVALNVMVK